MMSSPSSSDPEHKKEIDDDLPNVKPELQVTDKEILLMGH